MRTSVNTQTLSLPLHLLCIKGLTCVSSFITFNQSCWKLLFYLAFCFHGCEVTLIFSFSFFPFVNIHWDSQGLLYVPYMNWPLCNFDTFIVSSLVFGSFVPFQAVSSLYVLLGIEAVKFESESSMSVDWLVVAFCYNSCPEGAHLFAGMLLISQFLGV